MVVSCLAPCGLARSGDVAFRLCPIEVNRHREILENELETVGLRLNKRPANVTMVHKKTGGVRINKTCNLTKLGDDPEKTARQILSEYKMHNVDLLFREDCSVDELIDLIQGNRKYVRCLYVYNKVDTVTIEEVDALARQPNSVVISVHQELNLDGLLERMWDMMGLVRVYTKRKGAAPDFEDPCILSGQRSGVDVEACAGSVSKELLAVFNFALVWGKSAKHSPQRVGLNHTLEDEDVIQLVPKTNLQQARSKGYSEKVQAYNSMVAEKRKAHTKASRKKRSTG